MLDLQRRLQLHVSLAVAMDSSMISSMSSAYLISLLMVTWGGFWLCQQLRITKKYPLLLDIVDQSRWSVKVMRPPIHETAESGLTKHLRFGTISRA
jgi:predicted proteasome-type protease